MAALASMAIAESEMNNAVRSTLERCDTLEENKQQILLARTDVNTLYGLRIRDIDRLLANNRN